MDKIIELIAPLLGILGFLLSILQELRHRKNEKEQVNISLTGYHSREGSSRSSYSS